MKSRRYRKVLRILRDDSNSRPIRVGFAVFDSGIFPGKEVFHRMKESSLFEPEVVVVPDRLRIERNSFEFVSNVARILKRSFDPVKMSIDSDNTALDVFKDFDIVFISIPYKSMTDELHSYTELSRRGKLLCYVNYSYGVSNYDLNWISDSDMGAFWRVFVPTKFHLKRWKKYSVLSRNQIKLTGYPKTEAFISGPVIKKARPLIILAPHHSCKTSPDDWSLGDFFDLADRYMHLPTRFPEVDFIFRPHPLLLPKLRQDDMWGIKKTEEFLDSLRKKPNVAFSLDGDYTDIFMASDGLIHNCGSFIAEYLLLQKPTAFMMSDRNQVKASLNSFGLECLDRHYILETMKEDENFVTQVIIDQKDTLKGKRTNYVDKQGIPGYFKPSQLIVHELELEILGNFIQRKLRSRLCK